MNRRDFLRTAGGVAGTAAAATASSGGAIAAEAGTTHTVEMEGVAFSPDRIEVAPGDTVVFENVGEAGHSVTAYEDSIPEEAEYWASGGFDSEDAARDAYDATGGIDSGNVAGGESWEHTFETEGVHEYFCIPHEGAEMVGEVVVTENPSTTTPGGTVPPGRNGTMTPGGNGTMTPGGSTGGTTHTVEMTDGLAYAPDSLTIAPGDTVVFENVGSVGHSVTAYEDSLPEGAEYWASGGFDSEDAARDAYSASGGIDSGNVAGGESWEHTFETEGVHEYFCIPHEAGGMVGEIEVASGGGNEGGGEGGEVDPEEMGVPFQAHWVGIATLLGIGLTLLLTFFFLKYGETPHSGYPKER